jgi:hypothetical protein
MDEKGMVDSDDVETPSYRCAFKVMGLEDDRRC